MIQYIFKKIVPAVSCTALILCAVDGVYAQIESPGEVIEEQLNSGSGQVSGREEEQADPVLVPFSGGSELNFTTLIAKTVGYFLLIIALIVLTVFMLKRFVYSKKSSAGKGQAIQVVSSTYVGPKKSLMLVEAAGRMLVISVTDSHMNLITELKKEEYEQFERQSESGKPVSSEAGSQFGDILGKLLKRPK